MTAPNARRKPRQERAHATVDAVLEATAQVLVSDGYDRASTNRIARRAGVSVGSLYQYFPNKEAIVEALAQRHLSRMLALATAPLIGAPDLSIAAMTRQVVLGLVAAHQADPELHRVLARQAPVDVVQRFRGAAEQALAHDMARRRGLGENRVSDPEVSAFLVVTLIDEAIRETVERRPEWLEDHRLVDALTEMVTRYVLPAERPPTAVLFDLDGTLIDSLPDIAAALSSALEPRGLGPFSADEVRPWVGGGAGLLVAAAMGVAPGDAPAEDVDTFLELYAAGGSGRTRPYPGVEAALRALEADGVPLAICTNKPRLTTDPALAALGWSDRFAVVLCPDDVAARKPAPDMLLEALARLGVDGAGAVYVGDSASDSAAAAAAGVAFGFAEWGYGRPGPGDVGFADIGAFVREAPRLAARRR